MILTQTLIDETIDKLMIEGLSPTLVRLGFKSYKRKFQKTVGKFKLELNVQLRKITGQNAGYVSVYPGIIYDELNNLVAELVGVKPRKGWSIAGGNIGNLQPEGEFIEWPVTDTTDVIALGELICGYIHDYGVPFWEDFSSISGLVAGYEREDPRVTLIGNYCYKLQMAAAYCILGNKEKAKRVLEKWDQGRPQQKVLELAIQKISMMD